MSFVLNDKVTGLRLANALEHARQDKVDSLEKLSTGLVFTADDPKPTDRAMAERLEHRMSALASGKRNINDAVSLLQTAESGFSEISNMLVRMKEINTAASSATVSDTERKFLFIEYQALHNEIDRMAATTVYNDIPLLNGQNEKVPEQLIFRIDDPSRGEGAPNASGDWNELRLDGLKDVVLTTMGLGLKSAEEFLGNEEGIDLESSNELLEAEDDRFSTIYDQALDKIATFRANYGAMQTRLDRAMDYNDVAVENIAAAKSKITDVDYAKEVARLAQSNILMQSGTALLTQNNLGASTAIHLIQSLMS
ncbi:MAG: flagellin [Proteobacteria bacterium]|nr:flagellin [Pseudomonadota bacterium]